MKKVEPRHPRETKVRLYQFPIKKETSRRTARPETARRAPSTHRQILIIEAVESASVFGAKLSKIADLRISEGEPPTSH